MCEQFLGTYVLVSLGSREDDGQDADELEDGSQEQPVPQHALQEGGLGDLRGRQVQVCRHDAHPLLCQASPLTAGTVQVPVHRDREATFTQTVIYIQVHTGTLARGRGKCHDSGPFTVWKVLGLVPSLALCCFNYADLEWIPDDWRTARLFFLYIFFSCKAQLSIERWRDDDSRLTENCDASL